MSNEATSGAEENAGTPEPSMDTADVREYHEPLSDVLAPLGSLDDNPTLLINDKKGWYVTCENEDPDNEGEEDESIYPKERRPRQFTEDYERVVATRLERTLYGLTSYKHPEVFDQWEPARFDEDDGQYTYRGQKPTPTVENLAAISVWGDIDLADDLKAQRPDLDTSTYEIAERAYEAYIDAFAELYGGRDAVYMLDSVGGAYIFGAPEAVLPITRYYQNDAEARSWVLDELIERSNEYLHDAEEEVNEQIEGADEVIHPDWANNINRQYKIPLTLHGDHDAVVTPVDVEDVQYREPTPVEDVDDEFTEHVKQWCVAFTAVEYEDRAEPLVETLWPEEFEEHGSWGAALDAWVEDKREQARREEQRQQAAAERRAQRLEELEKGIEGKPITPFLQDVYDALDGIDTADVVRHYASDEWDSGANMANKTEFNPSWRPSKSGSSCYVDHSENRFGDPGDSGGGYAPKAMALGKGIITSASDDLIGEEWGAAVEALRDAGYDVPIWTPEKGSRRHDGTAYEKMPFWAVKKAAVALGIIPEDSFVEQTNDDDRTYQGFPGTDSYANALDAIEDAGLEHGRSRSHEYEPSWVSEPVTGVSLEPRKEVALSSEKLIEKAREAGNADTFVPLWEGDTSGYESEAQADFVLCSLLAFWTGGDGEWVDQLYRESELMRDRWDEQIGEDNDEIETDLTYAESTIQHVLKQKHQGNFYNSPAHRTSSSSDSGPAAEQHAQLEQEVESLKDDLEEKESRVEHLEATQMVRKEKIEYLRGEIEDLEDENEDLEDQIADLKAKNPVEEQPDATEADPDAEDDQVTERDRDSSDSALSRVRDLL
jgi:predicted transcriptional regulator